MRIIKILIIVFILISCAFLSANEKDTRGGANISVFDNAVSRNMAGFNITYDNYIQNEYNFYASKAPIKKTPVKTKKTVMTNKQKAGVAFNVIGVTCLLTGVGLLAGSLVYSDNVEKNETKDFDEYKTGKNTARGLFYGSMAGLGTGAVCVTVSIPLFVEIKKTNKKK